MKGDPQDRAERAADYLTSSSAAAAQARAEKVFLEEFRKSLKAQIMSEHAGEPLGAQERMAYSDPRYLEHLEKMKQAVMEDEKYRNLREGANAILELFRTLSANERGLK